MVQRSKTKDKTNGDLRSRVAKVITTLRPFVQADGGDLELVDVDSQGVVHVKLHGACVGCPSASLTLTMGIERNLKDQIPEVTRVVCAEPARGKTAL